VGGKTTESYCDEGELVVMNVFILINPSLEYIAFFLNENARLVPTPLELFLRKTGDQCGKRVPLLLDK